MLLGEMNAPLVGVCVLDLTHHVAGPYCTRLLLDYGASVLKVERPGGDPARRLPPFLVSSEGHETSLLFLYLNQGKETLTLDLSSEEGRNRCLELARVADVVVENYRPGTLDRLGLGWESFQAANPRLVLTSISNFGQDGPYRDYRAWDIVADALGGLAYIFGYPDREPLTHANPQAQYRAGVYAASATVAALLHEGGTFYSENRGKLGITLDLREPGAVTVFRDLVQISDFVMENYTPRVMSSFGLDYESLRSIRPELIMLSSTGYGHSGPWSNYAAVGPTTEAASGLTAVSGYHDGRPVMPDIPYTDYIAAEQAVLAILLALFRRKRSGRGGYVDVAQIEAQAALAGDGGATSSPSSPLSATSACLTTRAIGPAATR
ncbi:MAG: CoA transferase [Dehalococcoidia bacterium]